MSDYMLFGIFPYVVVAIFLVGTNYRYRATSFKFSSLSSQFLEGRELFWGSLPFHIGILFLFFGHLIAFLFPRAVLAWDGMPLRLLILEVSGFVFGLSVLFGILNLILRRFSKARIRAVTSFTDILVLLVLLIQVTSGLWIALGERWGSAWFAAVLTPYLRSIFFFNPKVELMSAMPFVVQFHVLGAFALVALVPFTRLVHFLVPPVNYLWRSYQQVIWYWDRRAIRNPDHRLPVSPPKNN